MKARDHHDDVMMTRFTFTMEGDKIVKAENFDAEDKLTDCDVISNPLLNKSTLNSCFLSQLLIKTTSVGWISDDKFVA